MDFWGLKRTGLCLKVTCCSDKCVEVRCTHRFHFLKSNLGDHRIKLRTNADFERIYELLGKPPCPSQISKWEYYDPAVEDYVNRGVKVTCASKTQLERLELMGSTFSLPIPEAANNSLVKQITEEAIVSGGISRRSVEEALLKYDLNDRQKEG